MRIVELNVPSLETVDQEAFAKIEQAIEQRCLADGLIIALKDTLSKYPGAVHWHFKQGKKAGMLELTLWPKKSRLGSLSKVGAMRLGFSRRLQNKRPYDYLLIE